VISDHPGESVARPRQVVVVEAKAFSGIPPVSVSSRNKAFLDYGDVGLPNSGGIVHVVHSIVGVAFLTEVQCH